MSLVGVKLEMGGHEWKVAATVREGPGWRVVLRATDDPECRMIVNTVGHTPGSVGDLREALRKPLLRHFRDGQGGQWRIEVVPRYEDGEVRGRWAVFTPSRGSRLKYPFDALGGISSLTDRELNQLLGHAQRASLTEQAG